MALTSENALRSYQNSADLHNLDQPRTAHFVPLGPRAVVAAGPLRCSASDLCLDPFREIGSSFPVPAFVRIRHAKTDVRERQRQRAVVSRVSLSRVSALPRAGSGPRCTTGSPASAPPASAGPDLSACFHAFASSLVGSGTKSVTSHQHNDIRSRHKHKNITTAIKKSWPATVIFREEGGAFFDFRVTPHVLSTQCDRRKLITLIAGLVYNTWHNGTDNGRTDPTHIWPLMRADSKYITRVNSGSSDVWTHSQVQGAFGRCTQIRRSLRKES